MLHLIQRWKIMNKFGRFFGRISADACLKMDYFGSKFPKIVKCWGLRLQTLLPLAAEALLPNFCSSYMTEKCARPYSHWNYWLTHMLGKTKHTCIFCSQNSENGGVCRLWFTSLSNFTKYFDIIPFWLSHKPFLTDNNVMIYKPLKIHWSYFGHEFEWFCWVSHLTYSQCFLL